MSASFFMMDFCLLKHAERIHCLVLGTHITGLYSRSVAGILCVCVVCVCTVSPLPVGVTVSTNPGSPPASITFASVTSFDQTSYCHFLRPRTPHSTRPVCRPTRMFRSTSVASTTDLQGGGGGEG